MRCSSCGHENPDGNRFCGACGEALDAKCPKCGHDNPPDHKFCGQCGAAIESVDQAAAPSVEPPRPAYTPPHLAEKVLKSRAALEGERKQVTVLFADIKGSMELVGQLDAETWHKILDGFFAILTDCIHRFEGTVNQFTGDGVMALFGALIAHEDHAQRACYAALQMRDQLRDYGDRLRIEHGISFGVRGGINSGDVVVGKIGDDLRMDYTAQGETVGIAQRIEQLAEFGRVYLSDATERTVRGYFALRSLGATQLKGLEEAIEIFELENASAAHTRLAVAQARGLTRFVGRHAEMETLETALERVKEGHGQVLGVVGDAGLGKSRLCYEFAERCRAQDIVVYEAHCPAHGRNAPFLPVLELFRSYFGIVAQDAPTQSRQKIAGTVLLLDSELNDSLPVLFEFMGVADPTKPPSTMESEARQRLLFSLIHRVTRARSAQGDTVVVVIDDLHWIDPGSDTYVAQMVEAVEGNRSLLLLNFRPEYEAAWIRKSHYQQLPLVPLGTADVRELVQSILGADESLNALIERVLDWTGGNPFFAEEVVRTLIETGAVQGQNSQYLLVTDIDDLNVPTNVRAVLAARIDRLVSDAKRVLQRAAVIGKAFELPVLREIVDIAEEALPTAIETLKRSEFIYEQSLYPIIAYAFKHPLSHEVAYESQLGDSRNETHAAVARALESHAEARIDETAALLAHHWDAAGDESHARDWHQRAAEWAAQRDPPASLRHWLRVRALIDDTSGDPGLLSLGALACSRILYLNWRVGGAVDESRRYFEDGSHLAERSGDTVTLTNLTGGFGVVCAISGFAHRYRQFGVQAMELADTTNDRGLQASMRHFSSRGNMWLGDFEEALPIAIQGYELASDDPGFGVEHTGAHPRISALFALGLIAVLTGRFDDAERYAEEARQLCEKDDFGDQRVWGMCFVPPLASVFKGDPADRALGTTAIDIGERLGTFFSLLVAYGSAGVAFFARGEWNEAIAAFERCLEIERDTSSMVKPMVLASYAEALLETGAANEARRRAEEAVASAVSTDYRWDARPWYALARISIANGDRVAAKRALTDMQAEIQRTGSLAYRPMMHECRAEYAAAFDDEWQYADEIREAHRLFNELGAEGHVQRVEPLLR